MIVRFIDFSKLDKFDFFNDYQDTKEWLIKQGRYGDSLKLEQAWKEFLNKKDDNDTKLERSV